MRPQPGRVEPALACDRVNRPVLVELLVTTRLEQQLGRPAGHSRATKRGVAHLQGRSSPAAKHGDDGVDCALGRACALETHCHRVRYRAFGETLRLRPVAFQRLRNSLQVGAVLLLARFCVALACVLDECLPNAGRDEVSLDVLEVLASLRIATQLCQPRRRRGVLSDPRGRQRLVILVILAQRLFHITEDLDRIDILLKQGLGHRVRRIDLSQDFRRALRPRALERHPSFLLLAQGTDVFECLLGTGVRHLDPEVRNLFRCPKGLIERVEHRLFRQLDGLVRPLRERRRQRRQPRQPRYT